jgi:hypothetical protein
LAATKPAANAVATTTVAKRLPENLRMLGFITYLLRLSPDQGARTRLM